MLTTTTKKRIMIMKWQEKYIELGYAKSKNI
jgi:hypothetical protein